ncbi:MAG: bifunctional 4-hydroxy-3-methylbut-2-enyl diphosphate reductase/30S ribosomal protein S1 [Tissierellia bacterium]|nr:bifunctional 4-hydroxy-3-methylbut-2-enyl diphosphate reductase/30S ribosomal protein S1 [Tissierellia bacterium]
MNLIVAKNAGFCFGVKRAVNMAFEQSDSPNEKAYTYGELVHNPQVVKELEQKGVTMISNIDDLDGGSVIVRSHGVPKKLIDQMEEKKLNIINCTCPYVLSVQKIVEEWYNKGYDIIIIGDKNHPEIIGINGYCNDEAYIVNSEVEASLLPQFEKACVVSQTTNTLEKFERISKLIEEKSDNISINNTICNATRIRQESAAELARCVDAMVVIGGKNSSNTRKLVEISEKYCKNVFHIETIKDLSLQDVQKFNTIGITAGASTPDWIIKEAVNVMDNLNNDEMMEAIESSFTRIHRGEIVKGTVLYVTDNEVMVNINYKADGIIHRDELSEDPDLNPKDLFNIGDEIDVCVIRIDDGEGNVVLSTKRVEALKNWDILEELYDKKEEVECKVLNVVKGGLTAIVMGINGFMPASHVSVKYVTDLNEYKGQVFNVKIIDFDKEKRRVILSRKEVEREEIERKVEQLWDTLEVGSVVEGTVQRLTDFGAFVDLGGVDGLIHISDLSWNRVKHPSEVLESGDKVEVQVLSLDREKNRISLGLKQTLEEPWNVFIKNVNIGDVVEGEVVNILDFGAFVRLKEGVDGLLHVSQISKEHVNKPSDVLNLGDKLTVKVIDINEEQRRISLSSKDLYSKDQNSETEESNDDESNDDTFEINNEDLNTTIGDVLKEK